MMDLRPTPVTIDWIEETGSTSSDLLQAVTSGTPPVEGRWLVADRQTAGRGRQGRMWHDSGGNFAGSTAIEIRPGDPVAASLSLVAGLALHEVMTPLLPAGAAALKWPNDLLVGGKKIAGILLERCRDHIVIGVGVNLKTAPQLPDRGTVSLSSFGPSPDRAVFAENFAQSLAVEVERWRRFGLEPLLSRWMAAAHPLGTSLQVHTPAEEPIEGQFDGLNGDGSLRLRMADGSVETITAGDVTLVQE